MLKRQLNRKLFHFYTFLMKEKLIIDECAWYFISFCLMTRRLIQVISYAYCTLRYSGFKFLFFLYHLSSLVKYNEFMIKLLDKTTQVISRNIP